MTEQSLCPNKKLCGSCGWSEISYNDQLKRKLDGINQDFSQAGFAFRAENIVPSPKTSHYRNRMDFVIDYQGNFGMREKGKWWKVIDGHTCFISEEKIEEAFWKIKKWLASCGLSFLDRKKWEGFLSYMVVRCTKNGELMINVITSSNFSESEENALRESFINLNKEILPDTLVWSVNNTKSDVSFGNDVRIIKGAGFITEEIGGFKYLIKPNSFFQTNSYAAEKLLEVVLEMAAPLKEQNILDLYCGSGFFTLPLSTLAEKTVGVEIDEQAVATAKENAALNSDLIKKDCSLEFVCAKSEDLSWKNIPADLVVVDPPRSGLHKNVISTLMEKQPKNIIYVSCNYPKFIEELKTLTQKYDLKKSSAVDMFPHTPHVELVSLLTLKR